MKSSIFKASLVLALIAASGSALAGSCATSKNKEEQVYGKAQNKCGYVTSTADISKNPYTYISPNGCDFGLSLPGLPSFGNGGGLDACSIVTAITGPMVNKVNQGMQDATNQAVNGIGPDAIDAASNVYNSGDVGTLADKVYGQMGSPTPSFNPDAQ